MSVPAPITYADEANPHSHSVESLQADQDRVRHITILVFAGFALLAVMTFGAAFALSTRSKSGSAELSRAWVEATRRDIFRTVTATGEVRLKTGSTVRIGSQLSGIVERLNVTVGSHVNRGDVIAEIDARSIRARIDQKKALVIRDQLLADKAKADLARLAVLASRGWISGQRLDDAKAQAADAEATLAASREDLKSASVDLNYVKIRAPIAGIVASVSTQPGETVAASFATPNFATVIQPEALEVIAFVDEADIGDVRAGQAVRFTLDSWPDRDFRGEVTRIAPVATTVSGVVNYEVAVRIDGGPAGLKPSMTADVTITTGHSAIISVPSAAIQRTSTGTFAQVRSRSGTPNVRRVRVGSVRAGMADVMSGIAAGEEVLVNSGVHDDRR